MDLTKSGINVGFYVGNHDLAHKDAHGYWLAIGTYSYNINIEENKTTLDISGLYLVTHTTNRLSDWDLKVKLSVQYYLNGSSQPTTKNLWATADNKAKSVGQVSIPGTSVLLLTDNQIATVEIEHNTDGTRPDLVITAYCASTSGQEPDNVPKETTASTFPLSLVRIPRGPRVKDGTTWRNTILYVKDGNTWRIAIPYVKDVNTWRIGGG